MAAVLWPTSPDAVLAATTVPVHAALGEMGAALEAAAKIQSDDSRAKALVQAAEINVEREVRR